MITTEQTFVNDSLQKFFLLLLPLLNRFDNYTTIAS